MWYFNIEKKKGCFINNEKNMSHIDVPWVTKSNDGKYEISWDNLSWDLESKLNLSEQCNTNLDSLESKMKKSCLLNETLKDATVKILAVQSNFIDSLEWVHEDIDLLYDPSLNKFRYKLFNHEKFILDINLNSQQIVPIWNMLVAIINNMNFEDWVPELEKKDRYWKQINLNSNSGFEEVLYNLWLKDTNNNININHIEINQILNFSSRYWSKIQNSTKEIEKIHKLITEAYQYLLNRRSNNIQVK